MCVQDSHLADMLCEAVPRALLPRIQRPKHRVTRGESLSLSTGCSTTQDTVGKGLGLSDGFCFGIVWVWVCVGGGV